MKLCLALLALLPLSALAGSPGNVKNFKPVMPGVLYRGGGLGEKAPLNQNALDGLCNAGFTESVYGYRTGWTGTKTTTCNDEAGNTRLTYESLQWDNPKSLPPMLRELHDIIRSGRGKMYVHCWYGVHASGYLATIALMQFCGLSGEQGVAYWNSHVPAKIQYPKVQEMIRKFRPLPGLEISDADRSRVCPK